MKYRTIDLCAGIGGIRKGFELTGRFENVLSAEIDLWAAKTYEHLFGDNPLNDLTSEEFKDKAANTDYDVLLAGFPCQSFSKVGKKLGFRDTTRGTIFFDIADIISRTNPKAVFLENVENLVSHNKGQTISTIVNTLEDELGYRIIGVSLDDDGDYSYSTKSFIRNTKNYGLPQNRPRAYIMAFSKKIFGNAIKLLTDDLPAKNEKIIFKDVDEILEPVAADQYYMAKGYLETLKKHKARQASKGYGYGYCIVNAETREQHIANTILATGGSGKERNLVFQPKEGVAGKWIVGKRTPLNDEGIRVMTPTEWGRLQGFIDYAFIDDSGVDKFSFPDETPDAQKYKQFGNSVSIPVIETMASFMLDCFEKMTGNQTEFVIKLAESKDYITKKDIIEGLRITAVQATYLLRKLVLSGELKIIAHGRYSKYRLASKSFIDKTYYSKESVHILAEQYKEQIFEITASQGFITRNDVASKLGLSPKHASAILKQLVEEDYIELVSRGRSAKYIVKVGR